VTTTTKNGRKAASALLVIPAILFALSACAPSAAGSGDTGAGGAGGGGGGSEKSELTQWGFDYAECMRGEGIDMPDPEDSGRGMTMKLGSGEDAEAMQAAGEKCRDELGDPPPMSAEEQAEADEAMLKWGREAAECYRENGYDMEDPKAGEMPEFPADAPEEVQQECGGGMSATTRVQE